MAFERPGECAWLLLFLGLDLFKKCCEGLGIVSALVHVLDTQVVSLGFEAAAKLQHPGWQRQPSSFLNGESSQASGRENQRDGGQLGQRSTSVLARDMASRAVGNLVRHDPG